MRNLAFLAILTVSAMALAGCSGDGGGDATSSSSSTSRSSASGTSTSSSSTSSSGSASSTTSGAPAANQAPSGSISVTVDGSNATFSLTGSDPDGDIVVWDLTFGDGSSTNGTSLPAEATHAYAGGGNFTANFTITDGTDPVTYDIAVLIASAGGGGGGVGQSAALVWDIGFTDQESASQGPSYLDCTDGPNKTFNYDSFALDPATVGLPFKATITDASGGAAITSWTLYFNLADCSDYAGTFSAEGAGEITGVIPANAGPFTLAMATGGFLLEVTYTSGSQVV